MSEKYYSPANHPLSGILLTPFKGIFVASSINKFFENGITFVEGICVVGVSRVPYSFTMIYSSQSSHHILSITQNESPL